MTRIPFSVYDFFGYLSSGFITLAAIDFAQSASLSSFDNPGIPLGLFWVLLTYVAGHIIANIASFLYEGVVVGNCLGSPSTNLFRSPESSSRWETLFPGYLRRLPMGTQRRVLEKAKRLANIDTPGEGLFLHCHPLVKRNQVTMDRLNEFLRLYGFCRNLSLATAFAFLILLMSAVATWSTAPETSELRLAWASVAMIASAGMFYRYLKFYRHYSAEVFVSYAESD